MENATKALLIAGGVLLAIIIISLGVYFFQSAGALSKSYDEKLEQDSINVYNNKFLTYAKDINAQNMVSLLNLVKENNEKNSAIAERQIKLLINNIEVDMGVATEKWKINIMQLEDNKEESSYKFVAVKYSNGGYINRLEYKTTKAGYIYVPVVCNHNWGIYNSLGELGHVRKCTKCQMEENVEHTYGNYENKGNGIHLKTCNYCGYKDEKEHNWMAFTDFTSEKHRSKCAQCSATKEENHQWGNYQNLGISSGHKRTCSICGRAQTGTHTWGNWQITVTPTCIKDGEKKSTCSICNQTKTEVIKGTEHDFSISATCTTPKECTRCGEKSGNPLGHIAGAKATCTTVQTCTRCSTVLANALGHSAGATPTCTEAQRCTRCSTVLANALGHSAGAGPTCTEVQRCTRCRIILKNKLGHSAGAVATCTEVQRCTRCSTVLANALGHSAGAGPTCTEVQRCTRCRIILKNKLGHNAGAVATCTKPQRCTRCSEILTPAKGHSDSCYSTVCTGNFELIKTESVSWCPVCWDNGSLWRTRYYYKCNTCGKETFYEPEKDGSDVRDTTPGGSTYVERCSKCKYRRQWPALGDKVPTHNAVTKYLICTN